MKAPDMKAPDLSHSESGAPAPQSRPIGVSIIVVTLGKSPWLQECLQALRREGKACSHQGPIEIFLVDQGQDEALPPGEVVDRHFRPGRNLGFAAANNLALAAARGRFLALINDDAVVEEGWLGGLTEALEAQPLAGAAQGVNLRLKEPGRVDGYGLGWNRRWQAVQVGHGEAAMEADKPIQEIFGASATAALYRREALESVGGPGLQVFDTSLGSYYEDVDLACRLRRQGFGALLVPKTRARHAGSTTAETLASGSTPWIYGNRLLVLARLLGRGLWPRLPFLLLRDTVDLLRTLRKGEGKAALGIVRGWARALRKISHFAHLGRPWDPRSHLSRSPGKPETRNIVRSP